MKYIAFCYTGYLRSWADCWKNHRDNLWAGNTCALYFYTYENPLHIDEFRSLINYDNNYVHTRHFECPHPFYDDPFGDHKWKVNKAPETQIHQVLNMMHNNLIGFSMIPKGYDFYVRVRPDMKFNGPLNFNDYEPKPNTIYIPKGHDYRGLNDQFAFGDYDTMRKYYSVYLNASDLWNEGNLFNSEVFHLANLKKQGVEIVRIEHPQHDLMR